MADYGFWQSRKVMITGHSGFKGIWLTQLLLSKGANIFGYSLPCVDNTSSLNANRIVLQENIRSEWGDIRDLQKIEKFIKTNG